MTNVYEMSVIKAVETLNEPKGSTRETIIAYILKNAEVLHIDEEVPVGLLKRRIVVGIEAAVLNHKIVECVEFSPNVYFPGNYIPEIVTDICVPTPE